MNLKTTSTICVVNSLCLRQLSPVNTHVNTSALNIARQVSMMSKVVFGLFLRLARASLLHIKYLKLISVQSIGVVILPVRDIFKLEKMSKIKVG